MSWVNGPANLIQAELMVCLTWSRLLEMRSPSQQPRENLQPGRPAAQEEASTSAPTQELYPKFEGGVGLGLLPPPRLIEGHPRRN